MSSRDWEKDKKVFNLSVALKRPLRVGFVGLILLSGSEVSDYNEVVEGPYIDEQEEESAGPGNVEYHLASQGPSTLLIHVPEPPSQI